MNTVSEIVHAFEDEVWDHAFIWKYYSHELEDKTVHNE
jgi:hypothetical protein